MAAVTDFLAQVGSSLNDSTFNKITLSKPINPTDDLLNVYVRKIDLKDIPHLSFTFHHQTKDETRNFSFEAGQEEIQALLSHSFKNGTMHATTGTYSLLTSKKGKKTFNRSKSSAVSPTNTQHDRVKKKRASLTRSYLTHLGISDDEGNIIPKMADKYRQINKFLEVMEGLFKEVPSKDRPLEIIDMGSGKGYLTFALYDFLTNTKKIEVNVKGIEVRDELVKQCNDLADQCNFKKLSFESKTIEDFNQENIDVLIALHACDTATDDALAKGLKGKAELIVCAPCCHKQVRQQLKGVSQSSPVLKYGIFKERQFEMVTDTIRALILEKNGYQSKVFEFVSNEHTRKNVMLVGVNKHSPQLSADEKIDAIKSEFGITYQQLEKLV